MKCPLCDVAPPLDYLRSRDARQYWICGGCDLIWLNEAQRPSRLAEEARYRTHENHGAEYLNYLGKTAIPLVELLPAHSRGLDYGCGPTQGMEKVLEPFGLHVDSYDPIFFPKDWGMIKNRFDFLICSEAAEHFFHPLEEFSRMDLLLKEGGYLAISSRLAVPKENFDSWTYRRDPTHVVFYQEKTVKWLAAHFGWELIRLENPLWIFKKPGVLS